MDQVYYGGPQFQGRVGGVGLGPRPPPSPPPPFRAAGDIIQAVAQLFMHFNDEKIRSFNNKPPFLGPPGEMV